MTRSILCKDLQQFILFQTRDAPREVTHVCWCANKIRHTLQSVHQSVKGICLRQEHQQSMQALQQVWVSVEQQLGEWSRECTKALLFVLDQFESQKSKRRRFDELNQTNNLNHSIRRSSIQGIAKIQNEFPGEFVSLDEETDCQDSTDRTTPCRKQRQEELSCFVIFDAFSQELLFKTTTTASHTERRYCCAEPSHRQIGQFWRCDKKNIQCLNDRRTEIRTEVLCLYGCR